ncbi:EAL domain-containing protein [Roseicyclus sp.]|uniref:EAL domain-containing protein n=1 Tax=Roseicyclus sp. TaxID=1914329 RepID=UPI003F6B93AE
MPHLGMMMLARLATTLDRGLNRLDTIALFAIMALVAIWLGLDDIVTAMVFVLPILLALRILLGREAAPAAAQDAATLFPAHDEGLAGRAALAAMLARVARRAHDDSACILLELDDWDRIAERWGNVAANDILSTMRDRLIATLRHDDMLVHLGAGHFGVALHPMRSAPLGTRMQICDRLRAAVADPVVFGTMQLRLTASAGHASLRHDGGGLPEPTLRAAGAALDAARHNGPDAQRAYDAALAAPATPSALSHEVASALIADEFQPWFQPQIATQSGVIVGFEALARWHHPKRGILLPAHFLPAIADAGLMGRFGRRILHHALTAARGWDQAGLRVPSVSVNFSADELRDPSLADHVKWELDRFDLRPGRLTVEIRETVAANAQDGAINDNIAALRRHGVNIDLDDFGVGQASIAAIRRFGVSRIKIDRSYLAGLADDPAQHAALAAILAMGRHLGIETLAKGVESAPVQDILDKLGCDHMQGFHIGAAMPFDATHDWATRHNATLTRGAPQNRRAG